MTDLKSPAQRAEVAREKALSAAVRRFSTQAYDQVGLRHVAADAGLDVARVHRLFGSKEQLFADSARQAFGDWPADVTTPQALVESLTAQVLSAATQAEGDALLLLVRSVSDPHAAPVLRARMEERFLRPAAEIALAAGAGDGTREGAELQAALLAACCLGMAILRDVLAVSALAAPADARLTGQIARLLDACLAPQAGPGTARPASPPATDAPSDASDAAAPLAGRENDGDVPVPVRAETGLSATA